MNVAPADIVDPLLAKLAAMLLHSIWQGCVLAAIAGLITVVLPRGNARARYAVLVVCLVAMLLAPLVTLLVSGDPAGLMLGVDADMTTSTGDAGTAPAATEAMPGQGASRSDSPAAGDARGAEAAASAPGMRVLASLRAWVIAQRELVVGLWLVGIALLSLRLAIGVASVARLRRASAPALDLDLEARVRELSRRLGVKRAVRVLSTGAARIPAVLGWFRPVILLPAAALTGLRREHLEALILHELVHIRRHDPLVNLLQALAETLLFYHPALWWVSRCVRIEREHVCDEIAADHCVSRVTYARALLSWEALKGDALPLGVAASSGGSLTARVRHLLGVHARRSSLAWLPLTLCVAVAVVSGAAIVRSGPVASPVEIAAAKSESGDAKAIYEAAEGRSILIRAVDRATGEPLAGVKLAGSTGGQWPLRGAETDGAGRARIALPDGPVRSWLLTARSPGHVPLRIFSERSFAPSSAPASERVEPDAGSASDEVLLAMEPATTIGGSIRDATGRGIAGARVFLVAPDRLDDPEAAGPLVHADLCEREVVTDDGGRWRCDLVPARLERFRYRVVHPGFRRRPMGPPAVSVDALRGGEEVVVLEKGFRVEGVVLDAAGEPVAAASVAQGDPIVRLASGLVLGEGARTRTDDRGRFRFESAGPEIFELSVQKRGFAPEFRRIDVPSDGCSVEVCLRAARIARGRVLDAGGRPVGGAHVAVEEWRGARVLDWSVMTDVEGRFVWENAPQEAVFITIATSEHGRLEGQLLAPVAAEQEFRFARRPARSASETSSASKESSPTLPSSSTSDAAPPTPATPPPATRVVRGRLVLDEDPEAIGADWEMSRLRLIARRDRHGHRTHPSVEGQLAADGTFRFDGAVPGEYTVWFDLGAKPPERGLRLPRAGFVNREVSVPAAASEGSAASRALDLGRVPIVVPKAPEVGAPAPPLALRTLEGEAFDLEALRGKVVLVHFWNDTATQLERELRQLRAIHATYKDDQGFVMLGVYFELEEERARDSARKHGLAWPQAAIGSSFESPLAVDWGVMDFPAIFLVGRDGKIIAHVPFATGTKALHSALHRSLHDAFAALLPAGEDGR